MGNYIMRQTHVLVEPVLSFYLFYFLILV